MAEAEEPPIEVNVFEAANATLREAYIGSTVSTDLNTDRIKPLVLKMIPGWRPEHEISCRVVAKNVPLALRAPAFIESYAQAISRDGWKAITD